MIYTSENYREYLKRVLVDRMAKNNSYSLRSMAKQLEISPAMLSSIINGKKNLSKDSAYKISKKLKLAGDEAEYFKLMVEFETVSSIDLREELLSKLQQMNREQRPQSLSIDQFRTVSEWYHIPIIELCGIEAFNVDSKFLSRKLRITDAQAESALSRLERLEYIEKNRSGFYKKKLDEEYLFQTEIINKAINEYHAQMLEKGKESIEAQPISDRFIGSETFGFEKEDMKNARILIEEFFGKMKSLAKKRKLEREKSKTEKKVRDIYHLGIQFFNLTYGSEHEKQKSN